jgi:hypothetical protein
MIDNNDDVNIDDNKKVLEGSATDAEEEDAPTIWYVAVSVSRLGDCLLI